MSSGSNAEPVGGCGCLSHRKDSHADTGTLPEAHHRHQSHPFILYQSASHLHRTCCTSRRKHIGGKLRQRRKLRLKLLITTHIGSQNVVFVPSPDRMMQRQRLKHRAPLKLRWSHVGGKQ
ncbi:uncharacterized protein DS421_18g632950 [Arachis hypogaea]|nr:uncharacterized protein DS421_18g632950 [Arachis hypogaea]